MSGALVLFSGGQDSATCLAWALDRYDRVETVAFDYGQRHRAELAWRERFLAALRAGFPIWAARLGADHRLAVPALASDDTALTGALPIGPGADGLPNTFVPGRNLVFLALAGGLAYRRGLDALVLGASEADFSGYPDCRAETIAAMARALQLGLARPLTIETPLMHRDKAGVWALAAALGGEALVVAIRTLTLSCYEGVTDRRWDWGAGCGACPACGLRARGWAAWNAGGTMAG